MVLVEFKRGTVFRTFQKSCNHEKVYKVDKLPERNRNHTVLQKPRLHRNQTFYIKYLTSSLRERKQLPASFHAYLTFITPSVKHVSLGNMKWNYFLSKRKLSRLSFFEQS